METETLEMIASVNPTECVEYNGLDKNDLVMACGYIPQFFYQGIHNLFLRRKPLTLEAIAEEMDKLYMYGGFKFPFQGAIDEDGIFSSPYEEDPDIHPYVRFNEPSEQFELFVYKYGIVGIRDSKNTKNFKIARFD